MNITPEEAAQRNFDACLAVFDTKGFNALDEIDFWRIKFGIQLTIIEISCGNSKFIQTCVRNPCLKKKDTFCKTVDSMQCICVSCRKQNNCNSMYYVDYKYVGRLCFYCHKLLSPLLDFYSKLANHNTLGNNFENFKKSISIVRLAYEAAPYYHKRTKK